MIPLSRYSGKNIALFGLGGSGIVTAHALRIGGAHVTAFDDNPDSVSKAQEEGINTCNLRDCDFSQFDKLVLAPGVPLTHPKPHWSVELAKSAGVEIIGDIELFCHQRHCQAPNSTLIAITGTNGKSTTTALVAHVLESAGCKVEMGGNIGRAVLDFDGLENDKIYVVEVSSFQIDLSPSLDADVGILLNLSPDHLDRHGTMENYAAIKERLVLQAHCAIVSIDDAMSRSVATRLIEAGVKTTTISVLGQIEADVFARDKKLFDGGANSSEAIIDLTDIGSLRGIHNAQNACVAWKTCSRCGLTNGEIQAGFKSFPGLVDRMEELGSIGNVLIVNDSKGTNADATDMAMGSFDHIYWIAGGLAKKGGIESLRQHFPKVAKAYLIGEAAPLFAGTLGEDVEFEISGTLDKALAHSVTDALNDDRPGPVILMSPACSSFDQFPSYVVRGEKFRELVGQLDGFTPRRNA